MPVSCSRCLLLCVVWMEISSAAAGLPPYNTVDAALVSAALDKSNATVEERSVQRHPHLALANNTRANFSWWKTSAESGKSGAGTSDTAVPQDSYSPGKPASASPDGHPVRAPTSAVPTPRPTRGPTSAVPTPRPTRGPTSAVPTPRPTRGPRELQLRLLTPRLGTGSSSLRCFNNNNNNNHSKHKIPRRRS